MRKFRGWEKDLPARSNFFRSLFHSFRSIVTHMSSRRRLKSHVERTSLYIVSICKPATTADCAYTSYFTLCKSGLFSTLFLASTAHTRDQLILRNVVLMPQSKTSTPHRVLLVDDDEPVREMMGMTLDSKGFDVTSAANVTEALKFIATAPFDVLITDLHMPNPSDGFAVVAAMRQTQPEALTLVVSGYPDVQSAMNTIILQADEILVKPFAVGKLAELVRHKMGNRTPSVPTQKERVASILERCTDSIVESWLERVRKSKELNVVTLTDTERTGYLPKLIEDLITRLRKPNTPGSEDDSPTSPAAIAHGEMRKLQGYTPGMLVHDSRILQVTIFGTLQQNLSALDFSLLLPDVMTIADEVDSQLTQAMDSYMIAIRNPAA
jgi:DNA-binding response OmpR family regulator